MKLKSQTILECREGERFEDPGIQFLTLFSLIFDLTIEGREIWSFIECHVMEFVVWGQQSHFPQNKKLFLWNRVCVAVWYCLPTCFLATFLHLQTANRFVHHKFIKS